VKTLIDQVQIGIFENNTGKSNVEEFETQINNILNQATSESGKIGLKSLGANNRFVTMVKAGSKGSDLNISFMISCLGQQNVDGKRIPYGFEHRTLPHYTKYDDSPNARGFVESSYINGLSPQELFFHAMGGRVGLIDTAVKTSTTGYIQRRLIKGLEDLMVAYDMTIRTNKNKIVQFSYGDDNIDTVKVENQQINLVSMSVQDIYAHYLIPEESGKVKTLSNIFLKNTMTRYKKQHEENMKKTNSYIEMMIKMRDEIIKNVFKNKGDSVVNVPVAFSYIIGNIQGQTSLTMSSLVDITPLEAFQMIETCFENLNKIHYAPPTNLFKTLFFFYLSPKELLIVKRFNKNALTLLLDTITLDYKRAIVTPGEMVGMIAGQSIGEVSTQMTLNTFHFAGVASKSNVTRGVPRIEEILSLSSEIKNPSLSIYLKKDDETQKDKARSIMYMLEHTRLEEIIKSVEICFDPDDLNTLINDDKDTIEQYKEFEKMVDECNEVSLSNDENEKSKWVIRMIMDPEVMLEKNITMDDVNFTLNNCYENQINCVYSDYNADKLVFRIRMSEVIKNSSNRGGQKKTKVNPLDQSDQIYILKNFQEQLLQNVVLRGIKGIDKVILRKIKDNMVENNGVYKKQDIWVLDTIGTNLLDVLGLDYIDKNRTFSNDIVEIYNVLGIEAARQAIYNELVDVIEFDGTYINYHNFSVLVDRMTFTHKLISIFRHGINNDNIGPIAKASFEETPEMFLKAARHGELDTLRGISANVMCGQEGFFGTSCFQVVLDIEEMQKLEAASEYKFVDVETEIEKFFGEFDNPEDPCGINKLSIQNNVVTIKQVDMGGDNTYDPGF
jgi:DNA-directed RNA polymerase II subunit RPB1